MRPACQHLDADQPAGDEVDQGLEMGDDVLVGDRLTELASELGDGPHAGIGAWIEEAEAAAPFRLGTVKADVGPMHEIADPLIVAAGEPDPDAGAHLRDGAAREGEGLAERIDDAPGHRRRIGLRPVGAGGVASQQDSELVAAEAGHVAVVAQHVAQALSHEPQQVVTGRMTLGVVDRLEPVEVDQQEGVIQAILPAVRQGRFEILAETAPVRQAGQQVGAGDRRGARQRDAQTEVALEREACGGEEDGQQREAAHLHPDPDVDLRGAGVGQGPEVLAEHIEAVGIDLLKVGEFRSVEEAAGGGEVTFARQSQRPPLHRHQVAMRLAGRLGQGLPDFGAGDVARFRDSGVELRRILVEARHPAAVARQRRQAGHHGHLVGEAADRAAQLGHANGLLGDLAPFETHR